MRKFLALTSISLLLLCFSAYADQSEKGVVSIAEEDGSPETYPWQVKVTNGSLTDNGDGTASLAIGAGGSGDSVTVNSTAIDTTGNLKDSTDITWAITDGGAGGPDDIAGTVADDSHNHTSTTISGLDVSADINLTAGDALTLTDDDIDFDGGASPGGELGGTWASPTVDATHSGSSHSSYLPLTGGTLSGALTINDNNAAGSTLLTIGDATDADSIQVYGDLTISGGDITLGTSAIFSGGDTTSLNLIDAIDATTETTIEAAIDTLGATTFSGNLQLGETEIKLDATLSGDETWSGITTSGVLGATIAKGDLCYLNNDDGRWELADANLSDGYDKVLGICLDDGADGDTTTMLLYGKVRSAVFPALTIGKPSYISETAGDIVETAPVTTDAATRIVGFSITAEDLFFCPSNDYYTHT